MSRLLQISIIICLVISNTGLGYALDYKSKIEIGGQISEKNIHYNIQKSLLLKNYVNSLENQIGDFNREHLVENEDLDSRAFELRVMSQSLGKIQTVRIEKKDAEAINESVIVKLQTLQQEIKTIMKIELIKSKARMERNRVVLKNRSNTLSPRLIAFVRKFTPKVRSLSNSQKKKNILSTLTSINKEASKLALFESRKFSSAKEMDDYYSLTIRSIKREFHTLQALILGS